MTLNHCLFLVYTDISIISVSLHLRIKQAQPTIISRSDLCVISKLQLNKNDLKRRVKRERDRPKRLYKILLENRSSHAIYPIPLFSDSLSTPLLAVGLRKILFDYCLALFQSPQGKKIIILIDINTCSPVKMLIVFLRLESLRPRPSKTSSHFRFGGYFWFYY